MPIPLRADFNARMSRAAAKKSKDSAQARRLLALAAIYDGATRTQAAEIGGVTRQIVRDWVVKFNAHGRDGLIDGKQSAALAARRHAPSGTCRHCRKRADPGCAWRGSLASR